MTETYFRAQTLDDIMRDVIEAILEHGQRVNSTKGENIELTGVLLEITDPRARLSRTEKRGRLFSCLGEFCWYLAGSKDLDFISYYIPKYTDYADGYGAYGPRLFNFGDHNQVENVTNLLRKKPFSRRAAIQIFDAADIAQEHDDVPCTCSLQFLIRNDALHMITYMRSNDVYLGLPHDIFSFTMLQEIIARELSMKLGTYKHVVGSLHLYNRDEEAAQQFLDEGWQPTTMQMPPMPSGDPRPSVNTFLRAESAIRNGNSPDDGLLEDLDPYWSDLIRLLQVFRFLKHDNISAVEKLSRAMASETYTAFIDQKLSTILNR